MEKFKENPVILLYFCVCLLIFLTICINIWWLGRMYIKCVTKGTSNETLTKNLWLTFPKWRLWYLFPTKGASTLFSYKPIFFVQSFCYFNRKNCFRFYPNFILQKRKQKEKFHLFGLLRNRNSFHCLLFQDFNVLRCLMYSRKLSQNCLNNLHEVSVIFCMCLFNSMKQFFMLIFISIWHFMVYFSWYFL